jgi:hypothetical protein
MVTVVEFVAGYEKMNSVAVRLDLIDRHTFDIDGRCAVGT